MIEELKKPDADTQAKLAAAKARAEQLRNDEIAAVRANEAQRKLNQEMCTHRMNGGRDPKPSVSGQAHSDGMVHLRCSACGKEFKPFPATQEHYLNGITVLQVPAE